MPTGNPRITSEWSTSLLRTKVTYIRGLMVPLSYVILSGGVFLWVYCFFYYCAVSLMMCANNQIHNGPMVVLIYLHFTQPHYHHYAVNLKVLNFWNTCQVHSVECVSKIKSSLSIIFHAIYGAVCIQLIYYIPHYSVRCNDLSYQQWMLECYTFEITATFPRGQCVNP